MTGAVRIHQLKIAPKYFNAVVAGQKTAELRKDDRGYKVGDVLSLCEWKHGVFTGREWARLSLMCFRLMTSWQFQNNG